MILSFTRKSAREIVERIKLQANATQVDGLIGQTFHSWCMAIIKNNPKIFKQSDFTILDEDDRESCFKLLCGKNFKDKDGKAIAPKSILSVYSYAMNAQCSMSDSIRKKIFDNASQDDESASLYIKTNKFLYEDIIKKYICYKEARKYFDYDDILNVVSKALKKNKEVRDYVNSMYDYILVDEMQDTNPLQYELLSSFYENCKLFCVGDDAQAIYGFRGADFNNVHSFVTPDADLFDGYWITTSNIEVSLCNTPALETWTYKDLTEEDYSSMFDATDKVSVVLHLDHSHEDSFRDIITTIVIRDAHGIPVSADSSTQTWMSMWDDRYFITDLGTLPEASGEYLAEIYFNGKVAGSVEFTIQ
jgi:hypothetical protein